MHQKIKKVPEPANLPRTRAKTQKSAEVIPKSAPKQEK